jgi:hypothetical protein
MMLQRFTVGCMPSFDKVVCITILGVGYDVNQEEPSQSFGGGGGSTFMKHKKSNLIPKQRQGPENIYSI